MGVVLLVLVFIVGFVIFSKSPEFGRILFQLNNKVECKLAGLKHYSNANTINDESILTYSYLSNSQPNKPSLLLLHGFSADKSIWLKFAKHATKEFNVIIPDLRGHGDLLYKPSDNYSAFEQAKYLVILLEHLGVSGELTIVGNSMGGMIAAILANQGRNNEQDQHLYTLKNINLNKVVLLDPAGAVSDFSKHTHQHQENPFLHKTSQSALDFFKKAMHQAPYFPPSVYAYIAREQYLAKQTQFRHMFRDFFNIDEFFDTPFQSIHSKVLLVWGDKDGLIPVVDAKQWEILLDCKAVVLPNIGHMPMIECPKRVYELMR